MNYLRSCAFAIFSGWLAAISFDLFLHAGVLAFLYAHQGRFLLAAEDAALRIPIGYLSFLLLTSALVWLFRLARVSGKRSGFVFGLKFGALLWGAFLLGLYSISTAEPGLLLGWWAGQSLELGISGFVIGSVFEGVSRKRIGLWLFGFLLLTASLTVALQIAGLAPAMKVN